MLSSSQLKAIQTTIIDQNSKKLIKRSIKDQLKNELTLLSRNFMEPKVCVPHISHTNKLIKKISKL